MLEFKYWSNFDFFKFYKFFSFGLASKKETKIDEMKDIKFSMQFRGKGFSKKLENKNEEHTEMPNQSIITEIKGPG